MGVLRMSRNRKRACLQDGLFLNLPWLCKNGFIRRNGVTVDRAINWKLTNNRIVASGFVSVDLRDDAEGSLKIQIGSFSQEIVLGSQPRNFGGRQRYFICPVTGGLASVVWKPPGATIFASRHAWPAQVGFLSQFGSWIDRAHLGKAKIKKRLLNDQGPTDCELPPRPRGMRLQTYERLVGRFNEYQGQLDSGLASLVAKWSSS
jgi:hypothetical protein